MRLTSLLAIWNLKCGITRGQCVCIRIWWIHLVQCLHHPSIYAFENIFSQNQNANQIIIFILKLYSEIDFEHGHQMNCIPKNDIINLVVNPWFSIHEPVYVLSWLFSPSQSVSHYSIYWIVTTNQYMQVNHEIHTEMCIKFKLFTFMAIHRI